MIPVSEDFINRKVHNSSHFDNLSQSVSKNSFVLCLLEMWSNLSPELEQSSIKKEETYLKETKISNIVKLTIHSKKA